jgi:hypothetical protein
VLVPTSPTRWSNMVLNLLDAKLLILFEHACWIGFTVDVTVMTKFTFIIQELHLNYTNLIKEQIMQSIPFPTKEFISGTIWILLIKILNLMILSKRKLKSTYHTLIINCRDCKYSLILYCSQWSLYYTNYKS